MRIGVPKETKIDEYRVGLVPGSVRELKELGHDIAIETSAGAGIGAADDDYRAVGAVIMDTPQEVYDYGEMIIKVKEPLAPEHALLKENQTMRQAGVYLLFRFPLLPVTFSGGECRVAVGKSITTLPPHRIRTCALTHTAPTLGD